jgi:hypothetical protein
VPVALVIQLKWRRQAGLVLMTGMALSGMALAQSAPIPTGPTPPPATMAQNPAPATQSPQGKWQELTLAQQQALEPLAPHWAGLSQGQKNKWLTLSKNFANLPDYEKSTMHSRMAEWATLTPQQRIQARLNFGETNRIPQVEKKVQWEAYQSLSEDEKRKLAAVQPSAVMGAAPAPKPAQKDKLSHVQTASGQLPTKGKAPGVKDLDPKTLLPPAKLTPAKVIPAKVDVTPS